MRIVLYGDLGIEAANVLLHLAIKAAQLVASKVCPFLEEGIVYGAQRFLMDGRKDIANIAETQPLLE